MDSAIHLSYNRPQKGHLALQHVPSFMSSLLVRITASWPSSALLLVRKSSQKLHNEHAYVICMRKRTSKVLIRATLLFILFSLLIVVEIYCNYLHHAVNISCRRNPEYPGKTKLDIQIIKYHESEVRIKPVISEMTHTRTIAPFLVRHSPSAN